MKKKPLQKIQIFLTFYSLKSLKKSNKIHSKSPTSTEKSRPLLKIYSETATGNECTFMSIKKNPKYKKSIRTKTTNSKFPSKHQKYRTNNNNFEWIFLFDFSESVVNVYEWFYHEKGRKKRKNLLIWRKMLASLVTAISRFPLRNNRLFWPLIFWWVNTLLSNTMTSHTTFQHINISQSHSKSKGETKSTKEISF